MAATATATGGPALRVLHCYPGNLYGGVETLLATLAAGSGLATEFALCYEGRLADELRAAGAPVHLLGPVRFSRPWTVLRARRRLSRALAAARPDVVVCHEAWAHALAAPVVRRARRPLVSWMHGVAIGGRWYERLAGRTPPDLVLVNSHFAATSLHHRFPGARHAVLYCPVAPPAVGDPAAVRAEVRRALATDPDATVLVLASRMDRLKGHAVLIEALARLRGRPGWVAWVAGGAQRPAERAYEEELRAAALAAGIADRVRFLGQRADVPRLLAAADLLCQPNVGPETFGIALVEALYAGRPVVTTRLGGAVEVLTEACGVLVPPGDPAALAEALAALIDDPSARARLGAAGPSRARHLCEPAVAFDRLRALLADVAAGPSAARPALAEVV